MTNRPRGAGSLRERRPGTWELRVALGPHEVSGRSLVRSVTVHGDRDDATAALARWAATAQAAALSPQALRCAMAAWVGDRGGAATVAGRVRCLRSALTWAYREGILDTPPLRGMRGPAGGSTSLHAPVESVRAILRAAEDDVATAREQLRAGVDDPRRRRASRELHRAEQVLLLARLAADTGARRGELAALQVGDLDGEVLTISRGTSHEVVGPTKSGRIRRLTVGRATAEL